MGTILIVLQFGDVEVKSSSEAEITGLFPNAVRLDWRRKKIRINMFVLLF